MSRAKTKLGQSLGIPSPDERLGGEKPSDRLGNFLRNHERSKCSTRLDGLSATARKRYKSQGVKYVPDSLAGATEFWERPAADLDRRIRTLLQV